jgi:hypothetical protein
LGQQNKDGCLKKLLSFPRFLQPSGEYKEAKSPLEMNEINKYVTLFDA